MIESPRRKLLSKESSSELELWKLGSSGLCQIEEDDNRRIAHRDVMTGKLQFASVAIHSEDGDVVRTLIAAKEELTRRVEVEAARIVPARPFFPDKCEITLGPNREN